MGCNYYAELANGDRLHVGKSSSGWSFLLHAIPERDLNTLDDWREFLARPDVELYDCEDTFTDPDVFIDTVVIDRSRFIAGVFRNADALAAPTIEWQRENHAFFDRRHRVARPIIGEGNNGCIRNGDGPYDLIVGDFS